MKSNPALHNRVGFQNPAQIVWYAAHVLMSACTSSPAINIRAAVPGVIGKRPIPAYAGFAGSPAIAATANTTGYAAGVRSPGRPAVPAVAASGGYAAVVAVPAIAPSPAYPVGVAVPAFPAIPARAEQLEMLMVSAIAKLDSPKIDALKGWETAIEIIQSDVGLTVVAELPVYAGVGLVGSNKLVIGEITPSALQAPDFIQPRVSLFGQSNSIAIEPNGSTLESVFYQNALLCQHTIVDSIRNGINCKKITVTLYPSALFDPNSDDLQLTEIAINANVFKWWLSYVSPNTSYSSESEWLAYVATTPINSPERGFMDWAASNFPNETVYFTHAGYESVYDPQLHQPDGALLGDFETGWHLFRLTPKSIA